MALDIQAVREAVQHNGEFRVHLIYSRSGLTTVARMWHPDGYVVGRASGGGYDKRGAALGEAIQRVFTQEELIALTPGYRSQAPWGGEKVKGGLYGLTHYISDGVVVRASLDGACGLECILAILRALGFARTECYSTGRHSDMVLARR